MVWMWIVHTGLWVWISDPVCLEGDGSPCRPLMVRDQSWLLEVSASRSASSHGPGPSHYTAMPWWTASVTHCPKDSLKFFCLVPATMTGNYPTTVFPNLGSWILEDQETLFIVSKEIAYHSTYQRNGQLQPANQLPRLKRPLFQLKR